MQDSYFKSDPKSYAIAKTTIGKLVPLVDLSDKSRLSRQPTFLSGSTEAHILMTPNHPARFALRKNIK